MKKILCILLVLALLATLAACSKSEESGSEPVATVSTATPSATPASPAPPAAAVPAPPAPAEDPLRSDYIEKLSAYRALQAASESGNSSEELTEDLVAAESAMKEALSAIESDRLTRINNLKIYGSDYTFGPLFDSLNGKLDYQISDEGVEEFSLDIKLGETYRSLPYDDQKALAVQIWDFVLNKTDWPFEDSEVDRARLQSYDVTHADPRTNLTLYFTISPDLSSASFTANPTLFGRREASHIELGFDGRSFGYHEYYTWFRVLPAASPDTRIWEILSLLSAAL